MLTLKNLQVCFGKDRHAYYVISAFPIFAPVLVQMTVVHEPCLKLLQFPAHLTPLLGSVLRLCALLFGKTTVLGSSLREARKAVLGLGPVLAPPWSLQRPTGSLAGRWHCVPLRVRASHL